MRCFETPRMRLEKFKSRLLTFALLSFGLCQSPAMAEPAGDSLALRQGATRVSQSGGQLSDQAEFQRLRATVESAHALERTPGTAAAKASEIEQALSSVMGKLDFYPNLARVHGHEEPQWLMDRGSLTTQAILALAALERSAPKAARRETLSKLALGLIYLQRKERMQYPFGAHISWQDTEPFAVFDDGTRAPTAYYRTDRAYAVQALTEASQLLGDARFVESAVREALGMSTHLVIHGDLIRSFSPQPELSKDINDALPLVAGFVALYEATGNRIYSDIGALATRWTSPQSRFSGALWEELNQKLQKSPSAALLNAKPVGEPVTFQYIEAEDGRVVNKAIETLNFRSSSGEPGTLAVMGRENTFWMRFDLPSEDDYLFDLSYLQSDIGGGLVSVMMRIDGDKIFQVPLGDVDGLPILRRAYVDGPRPLRSGPHSFGIRFSGLLMTKPALLDSVVVQPALERREFALPDGQRLYLLRNVTGQTAKTDVNHFESWPPLEQQVVDGEGRATQLGSSEDKRRRKKFVTLPAYGVAVLRVAPKKPELE